MDVEQIQQKIDELTRRHNAVIQKKAALTGLLQAKRDEFTALVEEIRAAGYDPKTLADARTKAQKDVESALQEFEKNLSAVEAALAAYEKK